MYKIRGDEASGLIGGVTLLILCICTVLTERKRALAQFIVYVKDGMRYAMGVFTPIVMMSSFFLWERWPVMSRFFCWMDLAIFMITQSFFLK